MERHWTFDVVALLGIVGGFLMVSSEATLLAGVVAAACAYALLLPEFVTTPIPVERETGL